MSNTPIVVFMFFLLAAFSSAPKLVLASPPLIPLKFKGENLHTKIAPIISIRILLELIAVFHSMFTYRLFYFLSNLAEPQYTSLFIPDKSHFSATKRVLPHLLNATPHQVAQLYSDVPTTFRSPNFCPFR
jgi:hypothetical protein